MTYQSKFSEEEVNELLGDDLTIAASLAELINANGDIRSFLVKKLLDREEELAIFHLEQSPKWSDKDDWSSLQDQVDAREAGYINRRYFGQ